MVVNNGKSLDFFHPNEAASIGKMKSMLDLHSYITKMIIKGNSLNEILESLTIKLEHYFKWKLYATVLLKDDKKNLVVAAAPNLPENFKQVTYPLAIGPNGSSGTAAYLNKTIITPDIIREPMWDIYRTAASRADIKACWSIPIMIGGQSEGILVLYHTKVCSPSEFELEMFETCANLAGLAIDRDKRIQLEQQLSQNHKENELILKNNHGMMIKFKKIDGHFIHTFGAGRLFDRLGLPLEKLVGKRLDELLPADEAIRKQYYYEKAWGGEETSYEAVINDIHYVATLKPILEKNQVKEVIVSCKDITEQKRVEYELEENNQRYQSLFYANPDMVFSLDLDGVITNINPSVQRLLSYAPEQLIGEAFTKFVEHSSLCATVQSFEKAGKGVPQTYETVLLDSAGNTVIFQVTNLPMIVNGEYVGIYGIAKDLTEVKQAEEHLRKSDRLSAIGQLAAGIAHEIRNPLTSIKGFLQFLQEKSPEQEYFQIIQREIDRIDLITNEFLILSKPQAIHYHKMSIQSILTGFLPLVETQAHMSNIEIVTHMDEDLPMIYCDGNQMKQVFLNIIKNAIESMPSGGKITITVKKKKKYLQINIADQGCGISLERLKRLGEPFYSTKEKGTGSGLMIIFKIIKEHKGDIQIYSELNNGTEVEIQLPS